MVKITYKHKERGRDGLNLIKRAKELLGSINPSKKIRRAKSIFLNNLKKKQRVEVSIEAEGYLLKFKDKNGKVALMLKENERSPFIMGKAKKTDEKVLIALPYSVVEKPFDISREVKDVLGEIEIEITGEIELKDGRIKAHVYSGGEEKVKEMLE